MGKTTLKELFQGDRFSFVPIVWTLAAWTWPVAPCAFADPPVVFENGPQQIFKAKCSGCHGENRTNRKAELNLQSVTGVLRGGVSGAVIVPGDLNRSLLWKKVSSDAMPPPEKERLSADDLKTLRDWILQGAKTNGQTADRSGTAADQDREFWSFQPLRRPPIPAVKNPSLAATPIDAFLLAALEQQGLTFSPPADRRTLARRLSLDLIGLPPAPEEVEQFVGDTSLDAYSRRVDRWLASPGYGEHWGRHWLDVVGYSDSNGYHRADTPRPLAYRYRDYVVRAFNADKPYDRFWLEQLAGDELYQGKELDQSTREVKDAVIATHFLRNGPDGTDSTEGNEMVRTIERYAVLEQQLQITISAMFGLTIDCARCHSHKFDPLPQTDYYALQAIFYPAFNVKHWVPPKDRFIHLATPQQIAHWQAETQRVDKKIAGLKRGLAGWVREHRPRGRVLFADAFDSASHRLAPRWTNTAPGDDTKAGQLGVNVDSATPPGARIVEQTLQLIEAGADSSGWLTTSETFDWTPNTKAAAIQVTFDLVDDKLGAEGGKPPGSPAARIGFYVGLHDYDDSSSLTGGNVLFDGNPAGGAAVIVDYPGRDARSAGRIGTMGYKPGHNYGVRITNIGSGTFQIEQLVDGMPDEQTVTLTQEQLRDGAFGFEYCCGRSFVVDNVAIEEFSAASDTNAAKGPLADFSKELQQKRAELDRAIKDAESERPEKPGKVAWVTDLSPVPPEVHLLKRGRYFDPGPPIEPAGLSVLSDSGNSFQAEPPFPNAKTTGRRLAFARWATRPNSRAAALLARVHVNRLWMWHFGRGLVETPGNFGALGARPTHPDLLEWLAFEFVDTGWSTKHIQRLILNSNAYRQLRHPTEKALAVDRDNRLLWGFPVHRLQSEAVRDSMLAVAGILNRSMGGPGVDYQRLPDRRIVVPVSAENGLHESHRRSLYLKSRRSEPVTFLQTFDQATAEPNCLMRSTSTVVSQALAVLNGEFVLRTAELFAERVRMTAGTDKRRQVDLAFELAFCRSPTEPERKRTIEFLQSQSERYLRDGETTASAAAQRALVGLCQTLFACNEFIYQP